jgi:hypothetical protein
VEVGQVVLQIAKGYAYAVETAREENLTLTQLLILMCRGKNIAQGGTNVCIQGTVLLFKKKFDMQGSQ